MNRNSGTEYDTRKILEQMKEEYWRGLTEVEADQVTDQLQLVTIILGDELCGIPALQAKEILKIPNLVRVPKTPPSVLGIFNLRGKITSVIDIRPVLSLKISKFSENARVVIVEVEAMSTGVAVEEVREIIFLPREIIVPVAKTIASKEYMAGQTDLEGRVMVMLDMEKILVAPDFQA